eukprot:m.94390 g.94390  ORF g.94390 m.94390 type:complete len:230 (-) comp15122_c0_seq3:155-844(-)
MAASEDNEPLYTGEKDESLYSNAFGFLRRPLTVNPTTCDAEVLVLGLPFDLATTGRSGCRDGPGAVRRVSANLAWELCEHRYPWKFDLFSVLSVADAGDLAFVCGDAKHFTDRVQAYAGGLLAAGKTLLSLGGDHYVTLPLLRAHAKKHGKLALVHFDAHTDTYSLGGSYDHGTMFYHAPREGLIDTSKSIQIGIRTAWEVGNTLGSIIIACAQAHTHFTSVECLRLLG